jgi:hypothetical protein
MTINGDIYTLAIAFYLGYFVMRLPGWFMRNPATEPKFNVVVVTSEGKKVKVELSQTSSREDNDQRIRNALAELTIDYTKPTTGPIGGMTAG